jgi:hypothetical protein
LRQLRPIPVQPLEVIKIIDHHRAGLLEALDRRVATPVQPFDPGAVAQMEARHRIQRLAIGQLLAQVVGDTLQKKVACDRFGVQFKRLIGGGQYMRCRCDFRTPCAAEFGTGLIIQLIEHGSGVLAQPGAKARDRRERGEHLETGKLDLEGFDHALDQ